MIKQKNGRPWSKTGIAIRSLKVGEEATVKGSVNHVRGAVYYASKSLGVVLVCNKVKGNVFKVRRLRKARAA